MVSIYDGRLSWVLVPLSLYIIFMKPEFIQYFSFIFICIAIIGTIETFVVFYKIRKKISYFSLIKFNII